MKLEDLFREYNVKNKREEIKEFEIVEGENIFYFVYNIRLEGPTARGFMLL